MTEKARVVNFSRGGLFVEAVYELAEGTRLTVSFQDPDGSVVTAPAEVVWCRSRTPQCRSGIGLRYIDAKEGARMFERLSSRSNKIGSKGIWYFG
jgi:Tfp pilus assembly protein PilZ